MKNNKPDKPNVHKKPHNTTQSYANKVCFLCGREGHYGSPTSCYASKQVRKNYFN